MPRKLLKPSGLKVFLLLFGAVVGYAIYDYWTEKQSEKSKIQSALILNWKADQIEFLEWSLGPQKMKLKRTVEGWFFEEPIVEKADSEAVSTFIEGLVLEKSTAVALESDAIDWKIFGLDQPKAKIEIRNNAGEKFSFSISEKKNIQGDVYFRKNSENQALLVSSTWLQKASKMVLDFRDRRWARLSPADIEFIVVKKGKEQFKLKKVDNVWIVPVQVNLKLDQNKVRKFIADLSSNQVLSFDLKPDSSAMAQIQLELKDQKKWSGSFGVLKNKKHFMSVAELGMSMEISAENAEQIYSLSLDALRDRREPFQMRAADVKKIEIAFDSKKWTLALNDGKWAVQAGSSGTYLNADLLKVLLEKVSNLDVAEFSQAPGPSKVGKSQVKAQHMNLISGEGKSILDLTLTGPQPKTVHGLQKTVFYAKSNQVPYQFTIDEAPWDALGWSGVLTEPAKVKPDKAEMSGK